MPADTDHYEIYYADKLWNLLPAIYRTLDTDNFNSNGPLRELVNRIGAQAAILRRSIDRLWEDQSIESCDNWVIPYIGDLLATNLVASLDARGQRLDVAKTIYYRRRKGTVAILEEIAADITGWDARVVEFFRRLGRTRHSLDPALADPALDPAGNRTLQEAEGLVGSWTNTQIGGWADLRNPYGASQAQGPFAVAARLRPPSAFDEYFHTADFRAGRGRSGWYNIPNLGVFLWRLRSFPVAQTTPVRRGDCFTFDPTGRQAPLFAVSSRPLGDTWISPQEAQLPTPISTPLLRASLTDAGAPPLYAALAPDGITIEPHSLGVLTKPGSFFELVPAAQVTTFPEPQGTRQQVALFPESGRFAVLSPLNSPATVTYCYGFSTEIGAGPYDRRVLGQVSNPTPAPSIDVSGGAHALSAAAGMALGTVSIGDSLTYNAAPDFTGIQQLTLQAQNRSRPVIRFDPPAAEWVFSGNQGGSLVLEGIFVSGRDVVLRGSFDTVTITCCTFDPGNAAEPQPGVVPQPVFAQSIDGRDLAPTALWIEAGIRQLNVDRTILGPVRARAGGEVETLILTNSIVQAIPTTAPGLLSTAGLKDAAGLAARLHEAADPLSLSLRNQLTPATLKLLEAYSPGKLPGAKLVSALIADLNALLARPAPIYDPTQFAVSGLDPALLQMAARLPRGAALLRWNRLLLEAAYPAELADLTLAFTSGLANLSRCTLLGPAYLHRLEASECILDDLVTVENTQDGCVRFTAWAAGSVIPRQYESVQIAARAALFNSTAFGEPAYAQLRDGVDTAIVSQPTGAARATIAAGAQDGSEMGAFAREKNPIKEASLLIKFREFMPLGLTPIAIHVT
jgi:hypothetical protein